MKRIPECKPRHIDHEAMLHALKEEAILKIEREHRRRKGRVSITPFETPGRHLGKRDVRDVPQDTPPSKLILDQLGIVIPYGEPYTCPKCGARYLKGFPPFVCKHCGFHTAMSRLNLSR